MPTASTTDPHSALVATWRMSNEVNLYVLGCLPKQYLADRYSSRTRTVGDQFAHMHNVRLRWLQHGAPDLLGTLNPLDKGQRTAKELKKALSASADVIAQFLERCEAQRSVPEWNGPPATFLGYLVAHEAHHRGLAMVAIRMAGHKLPEEVIYGQWDWGKKYSRR